MIQILLAEDQTLVRDGLCALLEMQAEFQVVAVANGYEAVTAAKVARPDIAILDIRMPVMDGVACTKALRELYPQLPILTLTTFDDQRLVASSLEAGANAYLLKDIHPDDLANAIRLLLQGETLIPGDLARQLLDSGALGLTNAASSPETTSTSTFASTVPDEPLTERQHEVLTLIANGLTNREIAKQLYLSEGTIKNTVSEIYARLHVRDRVQAVLKLLGET